MTLSWSGRRKALYTAVAGVIGLMLVMFVYQSLFNAPPVCTDGKQNGDEHGPDCGGSCALLCAAETRAPVVLWARAFEASPQIYTAAAYIQNNNTGAGARKAAYTFQLFDADNRLVTERQGVADLPPVPTIPIVETGIAVGNKSVSRTFFTFSAQPVWLRAGQMPALSVAAQTLAADASRLSATVRNDSLVATRALVAAVLFDEGGVAVAASKSLVTVPARGQAPVVFTWGQPAVGVVRAELTVLPQ